MNKQSASWTFLIIGVVIFLGTFGDFLSEHTTWYEMTTPKEIGHLCTLGATALMTLAGALGININRKGNNE